LYGITPGALRFAKGVKTKRAELTDSAFAPNVLGTRVFSTTGATRFDLDSQQSAPLSRKFGAFDAAGLSNSELQWSLRFSGQTSAELAADAEPKQQKQKTDSIAVTRTRLVDFAATAFG
jgi:hypothetical protein